MCIQMITTWECNHITERLVRCDNPHPASDNPYCPYYANLKRKFGDELCDECWAKLIVKRLTAKMATKNWSWL